MNLYKAKNIMITGAAGFIGCNFVREMLSRYSHINVIFLIRLNAGYE